MAKLTPVILPNQKINPDGTYAVKIRIGHKSASAYIDTAVTVGKKDIIKGRIKQAFVIDNLSDRLKKYNSVLSNLKWEIDNLSASEIKSILIESDKPVSIIKKIDFLIYFSEFINRLKKDKRPHGIFRTAYNALSSYMSGRTLLATDITSKFLTGFEAHLKLSASERGVSVHNIMREIRNVFNSCVSEFNDEDLGIIAIPNNPYRKYKLPKVKPADHRDIPLNKVTDFINLNVPKGGREELAKELSVLSFFLCGMNAADFYKGAKLVDGRIEYNRSKTEKKRKDDAFISIKLIPEAVYLWEKYISSGMLKKRYSTIGGLNSAIYNGMKKLRERIGVADLQFYSFRHSFASIARNICRFSKDDIAMAMNHVDMTNKVTDIYINKDWSIVDDVQRGVVDAVLKK